ncbi:hypothetical protein [Streptomyces sp. NPDC046942]|uniref:hypothetical protein n=1 Tax=Streptomyces sp. NPDC046942 TaxID=3155137 RepID=UPI003401CBB0
MRYRRTGACSLAVVALIVSAAACASGTGAPGPTEKEPTGPSASGSAISGSASSGPSTPEPASTPSAGTDGSTTRRCLSGTVTILYPPADNPLRTTCAHVGTTIRITLKPPPNYRWAPVTSSQPKTVSVFDDHLAPGGTRSAGARAASPGTATLTSAGTYTPDPHGPPSRAWRLTLTVVP